MPDTSELPAGSPAEIYERHMVPAIFAPWSADLLELVEPQPGERVLDVACGTGIVARNAASMVGATGRVVGIDMNASMLEIARSNDAPVEWREGDALAMPFLDQEFDVVVCQQGLQFFPDRSKALREMHRVLVPNGRLGIAVWCGSIEASPGYLALAQALERHVDASTAKLMDDLFCLADASEIRALLDGGGFREVTVLRESKLACFASPEEFTRALAIGSIMRRAGTQFSDETMRLLIEDVSAALQPYVSADGLAFPMEAQLATARR